MRLLLLVLFFLALFQEDNKIGNTPSTVLKLVKENYLKHKSISYQIYYRQKFFSRSDTNNINAACQLFRVPLDTLFNGQVWFKTSDEIEKYYDLRNIYIIDHTKSTIEEYKAHENQTFAITGNISGSVINVGFLRPEKFLNDLDVKGVRSNLDSNANFYLVTISYPDEDEFSDVVRKIWIDKKTMTIYKMSFRVKDQGNYQYNEWNISNVKFDQFSSTDLSITLKNYGSTYKSSQYISPSADYYKTLSNETSAPEFEGLHFQNLQNISLAKYKGKFIILDFSYIACKPCIKAIPHLKKLQEEFSEQGIVVLAINSKDTQFDDRNRLDDFISQHKITYPIILTTSQTDSLYNVKAYPTIYAINPQGRIIFSQVGYSEKLSDTLRTLIHRK